MIVRNVSYLLSVSITRRAVKQLERLIGATDFQRHVHCYSTPYLSRERNVRKNADIVHNERSSSKDELK